MSLTFGLPLFGSPRSVNHFTVKATSPPLQYFMHFVDGKIDFIQVTFLGNLKSSGEPWLLNLPSGPTAWFLLWKFAEIFPSFLTISPPFAMTAEVWTLVYVMRELQCAIAIHQHFGPIPLWKLGFLLRVRKLTALQSKLEGRIFSQGGKTELFSRNVLKGQLSLISLQIPFGFLTACQSSKENAF